MPWSYLKHITNECASIWYSWDMSLIYIKGTPGSGKSTLRKRLPELGYEAHDADDRDMGGPYNKASNQRVEYPDDPSREWYDAHEYRMIPKAIQSLHEKARDKTIYLTGTASNEDALWHLFDRVLFLDIDEQTLKQRLKSRTNSDYGKAPHELELIMEKYRADKEKQKRLGIISIDATQPVDKVIETIVSLTENSQS